MWLSGPWGEPSRRYEPTFTVLRLLGPSRVASVRGTKIPASGCRWRGPQFADKPAFPCRALLRWLFWTSMNEVTRILSAIEQGDPSAADQLLPLIYDELRKLAAQK